MKFTVAYSKRTNEKKNSTEYQIHHNRQQKQKQSNRK